MDQGRTITFQLSTVKTSDDSNLHESEGHYNLTLNPRILVPFYAKPKVALYSMSFSNSFANLGKIKFKISALVLTARDFPYSSDAGAATAVAPDGTQADNPATLQLDLPDGNYTLSEIEREIAKQLPGKIQAGPSWRHCSRRTMQPGPQPRRLRPRWRRSFQRLRHRLRRSRWS